MNVLLSVLTFVFGTGFGFTGLLYIRSRIELKQHKAIDNLEQTQLQLQKENEAETLKLRKYKSQLRREAQEARSQIDAQIQKENEAETLKLRKYKSQLRRESQEARSQIDAQMQAESRHFEVSSARYQSQLADLQRSVLSYTSLVDAEQYLIKQQQRADELRTTLSLLGECVTLDGEISKRKDEIKTLRKELESVEEAIDIQSFGFYRPKYPADASEQLKRRLDRNRERQKHMVKTHQATHCPTEWTVDGNKSKGRKMLKEQSKLMLRAFNGESDAAMAKVKYSNIVSLETRINRSFEAINRMGESKHMWITRDYLSLRIEELGLVHEHAMKVQEEREEQRQIRERLREEEKVLREIERAKADAEEEEHQAEAALERAREELDHASIEQVTRLQTIVDRLESQLQEALERKAKAIARAQLTRSGHVYVLSNIGSFGPDVVKIGMTRRLDPLERVYELGSASVPFRFDVHALIFSEDAPQLEHKLHRHFEDRRINRINCRREYFRATLDEVRAAIAKYFGEVTFVTVPEAEEYRQTVAMLNAPETPPS